MIDTLMIELLNIPYATLFFICFLCYNNNNNNNNN